jgi:hypothetical protein
VRRNGARVGGEGRRSDSEINFARHAATIASYAGLPDRSDPLADRHRVVLISLRRTTLTF